MSELTVSAAQLETRAQSGSESSTKVQEHSKRAEEALQKALEDLRTVAVQSENAEQATRKVTTLVSSIEAASSSISTIAKQTNLLSLNAAIEAARAGEMGRGFSIVASEIRTLARNAERASWAISEMAAQVANALAHASQSTAGLGVNVLRSLSLVDTALSLAQSSSLQSYECTDALQEVSHLSKILQSNANQAANSLQNSLKTTQSLRDASQVASVKALSISEATVYKLIDFGLKSSHTNHWRLAVEGRDRVKDLLEAAIKSGDITLEMLFSSVRTPIDGTNPPQYTSEFDQFFDEHVTELQEELVTRISGTEFSVTICSDGYIPTHNRRFSAPQTSDISRNASWSRNKRIFSDVPVIATAIQSQQPYLSQFYARDTGETMYTLSVPLHLKNMRFGIFLVGYTVTEQADS